MPTSEMPPAQVATDGLRQSYRAAAAQVDAERDALAAFRLATEIGTVAGEIVADAARLRALVAHKLLMAERLTLSQLAERLGTSKARADQLIRTAKAAAVRAPAEH